MATIGGIAGIGGGRQILPKQLLMRPGNGGSKSKRTPAPINWASLRGDLDSMREAREAVLLLGMYHSPDASETSECLRLALRASGEYILELSRCLETRPQGKGGWQRFARLDGLREQIMAAIDAA